MRHGATGILSGDSNEILICELFSILIFDCPIMKIKKLEPVMCIYVSLEGYDYLIYYVAERRHGATASSGSKLDEFFNLYPIKVYSQMSQKVQHVYCL